MKCSTVTTLSDGRPKGHQHFQLQRRLVVKGDRQIGLAQYRAGDRQRVDRVGFPRRARGRAGAAHQMRWHSDHPLACGQQIAFQTRRQWAAILNAPQHIGAEAGVHEPKGPPVPGRGRGSRLLTELDANRIDSDQGVACAVQRTARSLGRCAAASTFYP